MNVLTAAELIAIIDNYICECGYRLTDNDPAFTKEGNKVAFTCPKCSAHWEATKATIN